MHMKRPIISSNRHGSWGQTSLSNHRGVVGRGADLGDRLASHSGSFLTSLEQGSCLSVPPFPPLGNRGRSPSVVVVRGLYQMVARTLSRESSRHSLKSSFCY